MLTGERNREPRKIDIPPQMGFMYEIMYFLDCISSNSAPRRVTFRDTARSVAIVEVKQPSIMPGSVVGI